MIILSVTGPTIAEALRQVRSSARFAHLVEFRLDLIEGSDLAPLLRSTRKPRIATCRPSWEGGGFRGSESERIDILRSASALGVEYCDLELRAGATVLQESSARRSETKLIVSRHYFGKERPRAGSVYAELSSSGADVIKLAYVADDVAEGILAFEFLRRAARDRRKAIGIAMGAAGEPTRILYRKFGGWATYGAPEEGSAAAPGQVLCSHLRNLYRAHELNRSTRVFGVVGNPVEHSKGIFLHNPVFRALGKNAVYCRFPVKDLGSFFARCMPYLSGCSVTLPFKEKVARYLDSLDRTARGVGAVNTIVRKGTRLIGTNTDAPAALDAIERILKVSGRQVLVLGAGGAARALAYEAKRRAASVYVANRSPKKAARLSKELGVGCVGLDTLTPEKFDIIANTTSVGMYPNTEAPPILTGDFRGKVVFDAVYNPPVTRFLRRARESGARIVPGTEMYLNQAALQDRIFTGAMPGRVMMRRLLRKAGRTG